MFGEDDIGSLFCSKGGERGEKEREMPLLAALLLLRKNECAKKCSKKGGGSAGLLFFLLGLVFRGADKGRGAPSNDSPF
jgi:hypothetical protein